MKNGLVVAILSILLACRVLASNGPSGLPDQIVPNMFGVNIHFASGNTDEVAMISDAGFRFIRTDISWAKVETTKGVYDFSSYDRLLGSLDEKDVRALLILCYGNPLYADSLPPSTPEARAEFAAFAAAAADHFKGRGVIWEVWNEPNYPGFWKPAPNPAGYVALVKEASVAIRAADPDAIIAGFAYSGTNTKFMEQCFSQDILSYIDVVSIHPYRLTSPETFATDNLPAIRKLISKYAPDGKKVPVIVDEWGYSTTDGLTEEQQAQYLVRMFLTNTLAEIPLTMWYDWRNDGTDPTRREQNFGTVQRDFTPKAAYVAMQTLSAELSGFKLIKRVPSKRDACILLFGKPDDYRLVTWTFGDPRKVSIPIEAASATVVAMNGERADIPSSKGLLSFMASQNPTYIESTGFDELALADSTVFWSGIAKKTGELVVTATVTNPLLRTLKGQVTVSPNGMEPATQKFEISPEGSTVLVFRFTLAPGQKVPKMKGKVEYIGIAPVSQSVAGPK